MNRFNLRESIFYDTTAVTSTNPFCLIVYSPTLINAAVLFFFVVISAFHTFTISSALKVNPYYTWSNFTFTMVLFIFLLIYSASWFRDVIREFMKKYEILLMVLFIAFGLFIASEALLFISFFWASFHSSSSPTLGILPGEGFYVPDPCELTFANTLLLSNAAVALGGAFVSIEISSSMLVFFSTISGILAWSFISLQIKEFRVMGFSLTDSVYCSVFYFLTGLHFFHLLVGLLLLGLFFWGSSFNYDMKDFMQKRVTEIHLYYNCQLFYWHFLEILWLFIFMVLYFSYLLLDIQDSLFSVALILGLSIPLREMLDLVSNCSLMH